MNRWGPLFGRILIAVIFVVSGTNKLLHFDQTTGYMESQGMPFVVPLAIAALVVELVGGTLLVFGWRARAAAAVLFLFLIPTTLIFHAFWAIDDPAGAQQQMVNFLKNLAIMGGLLYVATFGPGPLAFDGKKRR